MSGFTVMGRVGASARVGIANRCRITSRTDHLRDRRNIEAPVNRFRARRSMAVRTSTIVPAHLMRSHPNVAVLTNNIGSRDSPEVPAHPTRSHPGMIVPGYPSHRRPSAGIPAHNVRRRVSPAVPAGNIRSRRNRTAPVRNSLSVGTEAAKPQSSRERKNRERGSLFQL